MVLRNGGTSRTTTQSTVYPYDQSNNVKQVRFRRSTMASQSQLSTKAFQAGPSAFTMVFETSSRSTHPSLKQHEKQRFHHGASIEAHDALLNTESTVYENN